MATYSYSLVGGKILVHNGISRPKSFPYHKLDDLTYDSKYVYVDFSESKYSFQIDPKTDTVILAGVTITAGSQTTIQLFNSLNSSPVFQKASGGGGATTSASDLTSGTLPDARLSNNVAKNNNIKTINGNTLIGTGDLSFPVGGDVTLAGTQTLTNNTLYNVDRGLIEYTSIGGLISGNTGQILPYSATSGGIPANVKANAVAFIECYGFENTIVGNNFSYPIGRTNPHTNTPNEFRGIMMNNTSTDTQYHPTSYDGATGIMTYINIKDNTISGFTHKAIEATVNRVNRVNIIGNTLRSRYGTNNVISIYGDSWVIMSNLIDMKDSTAGTNGAVGIFASQADGSNSLVKDNTIINSTWVIRNTDRLTAFRNTYVSTAIPAVVTTDRDTTI